MTSELKFILEEQTKAIQEMLAMIRNLDRRLEALEDKEGPYGGSNWPPEPGDLTEYHGDPDEE